MDIRFCQTGDPWHDWGLCELYKLILEMQTPELTLSKPQPDGFVLSYDGDAKGFGSLLHKALSRSDRWNELHPRSPEAKKIDRCKPIIKDGRRIPGEKQEQKVSKEEWEAAELPGKPPSAVRASCRQIVCVPLTTGQLNAWMNPGGGKLSLEEVAAGAFHSDAEMQITQGIDPLVAKHHSNSKVRGMASSNSYPSYSYRFALACLCATVSAWKPFSTEEQECSIYLPEDAPFPLAWKLWNHLRNGGALIHPDLPNGVSSRNLPLRADGDAARLLVLLDSLQSKLVLREPDGLWGEEIPLLHNWTIIHYTAGMHITVGGIYRQEVPSNLFELLKPVPAPSYWEVDKVRFVPDCLTQIRVQDIPIQDRLAQALLLVNKSRTEAWEKMRDTAMLLFRNSHRAGKTNRSAAKLLPHFYYQFTRSLFSMTNTQLDSCKKLGELAGSAFHRDITLLSRLHNANSPGDLRASLELIAFRLFKAANGEERGKLWHISSEEFQTLLDLTNTEEWQTVAQTVSSFASLKAFNINLDEGTVKP